MRDGRKVENEANCHRPWRVLLLVLATILCVAVAVLATANRTGGGEAALHSPGTDGAKAADGNPEPDEGTEGTPAAAGEQWIPAGASGEEAMRPESDETGERAPIAIVEKRDASYEEWLAAGTVVAVSMKYMDFGIEGIWLAGETALADRANSSGVYVIFTADGARRAVRAYPLEGERTEAGTVDLYTMDLGYAAFEPVPPESVDTAACRQVEMKDLEEFVAQSLLVTLYEH